MADVVDYDKFDHLFSKGKKCWPGLPMYETSRRVISGHVTHLSNSTQSRPFPEVPINSMTPLSKQRREERTDCLSRRHLNVSCPGTWEWYYTDSCWTTPNGNPSQPADSTGWKIDLLNKIKNRRTNLGIIAGEYRETADQFKGLAKNLYDAYRNLRKGDVIGTTKDISSAWLLARWGVNPTLGDFADTVAGLQDKVSKPIADRFVVTKTITSEEPPGLPNGTEGTITSMWELSERAICYVWYNANAGNFTWGNPLEIAWELTPLSVVVDWMIPIGDWLSTLDALRGVSHYKGVLCRKRAGWNKMDCHPIDSSGAVYETLRTGLFEHQSYERELIWDLSQLPSLPLYKPSKSFWKVADGLALLHQMRGR